MATKLIINADDFGASHAVNAAVVKARQFGLLTSASLMVTGAAAEEAVAIAKNDPGLAVGLHLTLSDGRSCLPPTRIPNIVDSQSRFNPNPARAGLKYYCSRRARKQLRLEIWAQFEAFAQTGLPLSHVDGHQHLHAHPCVLPMVAKLAGAYKADGIRRPHDPLRPNILADRSRLGYKMATALGHSYLSRICRRLLKNSNFASCDFSIGSLMSGSMSDSYVMTMLRSLKCGSLEVFFHPADLPDAKRTDQLGANQGDLLVLLSPKLKDFIDRHAYDLTNYAGLRGRE